MKVDSGLAKAVRNVIRVCMGVRKGEVVLVIVDEPLRKIGFLLWEEACKAGAEAIITEIIPRKSHAEEPPPSVAFMMKNCNVILIPTSKSLSHTTARKEACLAGARIGTLPGITENILRRTLTVNYFKIKEKSELIVRTITGGKNIRIKTDAGTDLQFSIEGRIAHPDTGIVHSPGDFSNLPAGEVYIAPLEGTADGILVIDGCIGDTGILKEKDKIYCEVKGGYVNKIWGGKYAKHLEKLIAPFGMPARNIAELGIGTNPKARISGNVLEDEKVLGTVHIAFGDNHTFGGTVEVASHLDGIIKKPSLWLDGKQLIKGGRHIL